MSCDTSRRSSESSLGRAIENTIRLALSTLTVPFLVITDLIILGNRLGERSATEWGQALLLLVSVVLFAYAAHPAEARGFPFWCLLLHVLPHPRLDLLLDEWLFHGAWAPLAIAVALLARRALHIWRTLLPGRWSLSVRRPSSMCRSGWSGGDAQPQPGQRQHLVLGHDDSYRLCKTVIQRRWSRSDTC